MAGRPSKHVEELITEFRRMFPEADEDQSDEELGAELIELRDEILAWKQEVADAEG